MQRMLRVQRPSPLFVSGFHRRWRRSLQGDVSSWYTTTTINEEPSVPVSSEIPVYETHPDIAYPQFSFEITSHGQSEKDKKARTGILNTPHGSLETPNFIFCGTKAAMKSITMKQMIEENTQIILSNTFHLMITPGADMVQRMGGLHKMTGWSGPILTDSGGYQIFSMGHGSVSNEIKGRRGAHKQSSPNPTVTESTDTDMSDPQSIESSNLPNTSTDTSSINNRTLLSINENGAIFRSFIDGMKHHLTPEKSIQIQRQLGADLIVVFDECTPFNVDKSYTEQSMHRSHRWAMRCLHEFQRTSINPPHSLPQALYGIVQGGIYEDLRIQSTSFVNQQPFFGIAIGGSLGASKQEMHQIVEFTRSHLRHDRPIHLLGIGGIRDIFHGVRQGIDTFDCVHPTRLGRHGGALVQAKYWYEDDHSVDTMDSNVWRNVPNTVKQAYEIKSKKIIINENNRILSLSHRLLVLQQELRLLQQTITLSSTPPPTPAAAVSEGIPPLEAAPAAVPIGQSKGIVELENKIENIKQLIANSELRIKAIEAGDYSTIHIKGYSSHFKPPNNTISTNTSDVNSNNKIKKGKVREHVNVMKSSMRDDHRPIDATCECYTCRHYTRSYLHHLYKAKESLGGILVTIHNVHFMNRMMKDIRYVYMYDTMT